MSAKPGYFLQKKSVLLQLPLLLLIVLYFITVLKFSTI